MGHGTFTLGFVSMEVWEWGGAGQTDRVWNVRAIRWENPTLDQPKNSRFRTQNAVDMPIRGGTGFSPERA